MAIKSKKGVMFTIVAIMLVGVLLASVVLVTKTNYKDKSFVALTRVSSMNDFIKSVEQDAQRSLMIAGYRGVISLEREIATNGSFIPNLSAYFGEVMINGTLNGVSQDLMTDASINDWSSRINEEASKVNINLIVTPISVEVYHESPWSIVVELEATMNFTDTNNLASWYYNKTFTKNIDISSFEDPLYIVNSYNKVTNLIILANNTDFVNESNNDTSILYSHLNNSFYTASSDAPSFLMRLEGNLSPSPFGIESLVNLPDFSKQSVPLLDKSVVDYQYFDSNYSGGSDYCDFEGMPSWFRISDSKREDYELSGMGSECP